MNEKNKGREEPLSNTHLNGYPEFVTELKSRKNV